MADSLDALLNPTARHGRRAGSGSITSVPTSSTSSYDSQPSFGRKPSLMNGVPLPTGNKDMSSSYNNASSITSSFSNPSSGLSSFNASPVLSRTTSRPNSKGPTIGDMDSTFASNISSSLTSTLPSNNDGSSSRDGSAGRRLGTAMGRRASQNQNPSLSASLTQSNDEYDNNNNNNISGSSSFSPSVSSVNPGSRRSISSREATTISAPVSVMAPTSSAEPVTYRSSLYATTTNKDNKENNNSANVNTQQQQQDQTSTESTEYTPSVGKRWGSLTSRMQPAEDTQKKSLTPLDDDSSSSSTTDKRSAPLFACPDCQRQFKRQALIVHQRSCKKVQAKRETFNAQEKRLQDVLEQDKQLASSTPVFDKDRYQEETNAKVEKTNKQNKKNQKANKEEGARESIKDKIIAASKAKASSSSSLSSAVIEERPLDIAAPPSSTYQSSSSSSSVPQTDAEKAAETEKRAAWRAESLKVRDAMKKAKAMYNGSAGSMGIDISRMMPKM